MSLYLLHTIRRRTKAGMMRGLIPLTTTRWLLLFHWQFEMPRTSHHRGALCLLMSEMSFCSAELFLNSAACIVGNRRRAAE
jgi:hypothetical protein